MAAALTSASTHSHTHNETNTHIRYVVEARDFAGKKIRYFSSRFSCFLCDFYYIFPFIFILFCISYFYLLSLCFSLSFFYVVVKQKSQFNVRRISRRNTGICIFRRKYLYLHLFKKVSSTCRAAKLALTTTNAD